MEATVAGLVAASVVGFGGNYSSRGWWKLQ